MIKVICLDSASQKKLNLHDCSSQSPAFSKKIMSHTKKIGMNDSNEEENNNKSRLTGMGVLLKYVTIRASLVAQTVKNMPTMQDTTVRFLGWENPLEKGMATHSSILAWRIPWTEEPGGLQSIGSQRVGHN